MKQTALNKDKEVRYDEENDILWVHNPNKKSKYSNEVFDNVVIDVNGNGEVVGLEILNISSLLKK